ncbi:MULTISPECIES: TetR/AcrR family transcriptional regulator [Citricoccus]|uniref:TetR/AcrR family transcriptional regulator n=1 Tax=Citricoccus TaxID=169133 RepID=UPI0002FCF31D|nr:TetR/AcrR family transcriptional regulator [Citricoccus sp. CH26A]
MNSAAQGRHPLQSPASPSSAPAAADGRSTRWDRHRQQRRSELIRAARHAVHDLGPQASMDEIATHAGTSKSVFYRYFGDKNGLQVAVGQRAIEFMERELLTAAEASENALDGLYAMISVYLRLAESSPHVYAFSTRLPPEAADAAALGGSQPAAMADFSDRIAAVMDVHFRTYLRQQGRDPSEGSATWYWPRAAIGMVRSAGETWLATAPGPGRPEADRLARKITSWLTAGLAGTYAPQHPSSPTPRQETS